MPNWRGFVDAAGLQLSPVARQVGEIIANPDSSEFQKMMSPIFSITETEARQFGLKIDETRTGVVGLDLTLKQGRPTATASLALLADYIRSTVVKVDLRRSLQDACVSNRGAILALGNKKLENAFAIKQDEQRQLSEASCLTAIIRG